jgi:hypothetical protein
LWRCAIKCGNRTLKPRRVTDPNFCSDRSGKLNATTNCCEKILLIGEACPRRLEARRERSKGSVSRIVIFKWHGFYAQLQLDRRIAVINCRNWAVFLGRFIRKSLIACDCADTVAELDRKGNYPFGQWQSKSNEVQENGRWRLAAMG